MEVVLWKPRTSVRGGRAFQARPESPRAIARILSRFFIRAKYRAATELLAEAKRALSAGRPVSLEFDIAVLRDGLKKAERPIPIGRETAQLKLSVAA